jgi:hypothetical protein
MMPYGAALTARCLPFFAAAALNAQSVRGVVVDAATQQTVTDARIALLDSAGRDLPPGVRSDVNGGFSLQAPNPGVYRVRAMRIGFQPLSSGLLTLKAGELTTLRLLLTAVAQPLRPVEIVEQRHLTLTELMSPLGFDLRRSKGLGRTLDSAQLGSFGHEEMLLLMMGHVFPNVGVKGVTDDSARVATVSGCELNQVDVFLDGVLKSSGPDSLEMLTPEQQKAKVGRFEPAPTFRPTNPSLLGGIRAMQVIESIGANTLYGMEVFNRLQIPPPSLGGMIGVGDRCAIVLWTKAYAERVAAQNANLLAYGPHGPMQVVTGTVMEFETRSPIAGAQVTLYTETHRPLVAGARTDSTGRFVLRTKSTGRMRVGAQRIGYPPATSGSFALNPAEILTTEVEMSALRQVLAPLTIVARARPMNVSLNSYAGFELRKQRAAAGVFFTEDDIALRGALSVVDLLRGIAGVGVSSRGDTTSIQFRQSVGALRAGATCAPAYLLNGTPQRGGITEQLSQLIMSEIHGVEVYRSITEVPGEFAATAGGCGAILVSMKKELPFPGRNASGVALRR